MSMLEELFGVDEADEAEALERVIEGGSEDDERRGDDEAEEDKRTVDPTKPKSVHVVKNPRVVLNPARLTGPRGLQALPEHFKDFKFKGKGREQEDLDLVLKKLEHWAHRLYPKFKFHDCLKKIETLGKKRPVMVTLRKIRSDQLLSDDIVTQRDSSDDEAPAPAPEDDEFDQLLQEQIELARATPARGAQTIAHTPAAKSPAMMPKSTTSPSISEEQRLRMLKYRQVAEERRLARMRQNVANTHTKEDSSGDAGLINFNTAKQLIPTVIDRSEVSDDMNAVHITGNTEGITKQLVPTVIDRSEVSDAMNTVHITGNTEGITKEKLVTTGLPASNENDDATATININDDNEGHLIFSNTKSKESEATDTNEDYGAMDASDTGNTEDHFHYGNTKTKKSDAIDTINPTGYIKGLAIIENSSKTSTLDDATSANTTTNGTNSNTIQQQASVTNISTEREMLDSWDNDFEMQDFGNQYDNEINKSVSKSSQERFIYSDSSEDECQITTLNISVMADVHNIDAFSQETDKNIQNSTQPSKDEDILEDESIEIGKPTELSDNDEIMEYKSKEN